MPRGLERRQRLILALLLAFLIDTLRPVVHPVAHCHPNGGRPHVHLGEVARGNASGTAPLSGEPHRAPDGKSGIARAAASDLHVHPLRTLQVSHVVPPRPAPAIGACPIARVVDSRGERTATVRRPTARGPPPHTA
jgi:hypothetical protein